MMVKEQNVQLNDQITPACKSMNSYKDIKAKSVNDTMNN